SVSSAGGPSTHVREQSWRSNVDSSAGTTANRGHLVFSGSLSPRSFLRLSSTNPSARSTAVVTLVSSASSRWRPSSASAWISSTASTMTATAFITVNKAVSSQRRRRRRSAALLIPPASLSSDPHVARRMLTPLTLDGG